MNNRELIEKYPPKACPFCGSKHLVSEVEPKMNFFKIVCKNCKAMGPEKSTKERCLQMWNFRKLYKDTK